MLKLQTLVKQMVDEIFQVKIEFFSINSSIFFNKDCIKIEYKEEILFNLTQYLNLLVDIFIMFLAL